MPERLEAARAGTGEGLEVAISVSMRILPLMKTGS